MYNFIVNDEALAAELNEELSATPIGNRESLVSLYNEGYIKRNDPKIIGLIDLLAQAYKGIERRSDAIVFLSEPEILANEIAIRAEVFAYLMKIKRIVNEASARVNINQGSRIYIKSGQVVLLSDGEGDDVKDVILSSERVPKLTDEAKADLSKIVVTTDENGNGVAFPVARVVSVDVDKVRNAYNAIM